MSHSNSSPISNCTKSFPHQTNPTSSYSQQQSLSPTEKQHTLSSPHHTVSHVIIHPKHFSFFLENHSNIIRDISATSGAVIIIDRTHPPPAGKLHISGSSTDVSHCKRLIDQRIHQLKAEKPIAIWIPIPKIGLVVGVRGSTIRSINSRSGAYATVKNNYVEAHRKQILIYGPSSAADRARNMITDILEENRQPPDEEEITISVPHYVVGAIIGRGGANVKKINVHTGAYIRVEPSSASRSENKVVLTGKAEALKRAELMIRDIVDNFQGDVEHPRTSRFEKQHAPPPSEQRFAKEHVMRPQEEEEKIRLSVREIDIVVGREGKTLEEINSRSKAVIEFSMMDREQGNHDQTVYITGARTDIIIALLLIEERLGMQLGTLSKLGKRFNNSPPNAVSRLEEDRHLSPAYMTKEGKGPERSHQHDFCEPLPRANDAMLLREGLENPNDGRHTKVGHFDNRNSRPDESGNRKAHKGHDIAPRSKDSMEPGEVNVGPDRMYGESRVSSEFHSTKLGAGEACLEETDPDHRPRCSEERTLKQVRRYAGDSRPRREKGPLLLPMHPPGRSMLQAGPYIPMYAVTQTGHEPFGMVNATDPHGYPVYPGMHPVGSHYFNRSQASSPTPSDNSESISDGDDVRINSSEKTEAKNDNNRRESIEEEVGSASRPRKSGDRGSVRGASSRKRRKQHHPFPYGYAGTDPGFLIPHPLAKYPGYPHPSLPDNDSKIVMRRSRKYISKVDNENEMPSKGSKHGLSTRSSDKEECSSRGTEPKVGGE